MIVNHSSAFVFVHVPKAAGTTLARLLSPLTTLVDVELGGSPWGEAVQQHYKQRFGLGKHATAAEVMAALGEARWPAYFSFALVRNPYTRAFSTYQFLRHKRAVKGRADLAALDALPTFSDFVQSAFFDGDGPDRILREQVFWTHDAQGRGPLIRFIGSVECLQADLARVAQALSQTGRPLALPAALPRLNSVAAAPVDLWAQLAADPLTEQRIHQRYRADFAAFGYRRFDPAAPRPYDPARADSGRS